MTSKNEPPRLNALLEAALRDPTPEQCLKLAQDVVDLRNLARQLIRVALGQAASDHQLLAGPVGLELRHLQDGVDALLARGIDEAAGVDHDDVGLVGAIYNLVTTRVGGSEHELAVDPVLGATEGDEVKLSCWSFDGGTVCSEARSLSTCASRQCSRRGA